MREKVNKVYIYYAELSATTIFIIKNCSILATSYDADRPAGGRPLLTPTSAVIRKQSDKALRVFQSYLVEIVKYT